jgi:hypothetical protein
MKTLQFNSGGQRRRRRRKRERETGIVGESVNYI